MVRISSDTQQEFTVGGEVEAFYAAGVHPEVELVYEGDAVGVGLGYVVDEDEGFSGELA